MSYFFPPFLCKGDLCVQPLLCSALFAGISDPRCRGEPHTSPSRFPVPPSPSPRPFPLFSFSFPPCPPFLFFFGFFFFFFFFISPSRFLPRALPRGGREKPVQEEGGLGVNFFFLLGVCVCVCVAAARACGARVGERGRSPARLKEPWMARRGDMDSGKSGGLDHSETGRDAPGPG